MLDEFSSKVLETALEIVEASQKRGLVTRILGAVATYIHIQRDDQTLNFFKNAGRLSTGTLFTDVDLIGYSKQRRDLVNLMRELNFYDNKMVTALFGHKRMIFT
ncbi:MAG: hypothetical protein ABDH32_07900, partial [Candidatus Caldarchaeales archaeon]